MGAKLEFLVFLEMNLKQGTIPEPGLLRASSLGGWGMVREDAEEGLKGRTKSGCHEGKAGPRAAPSCLSGPQEVGEG